MKIHFYLKGGKKLAQCPLLKYKKATLTFAAMPLIYNVHNPIHQSYPAGLPTSTNNSVTGSMYSSGSEFIRSEQGQLRVRDRSPVPPLSPSPTHITLSIKPYYAYRIFALHAHFRVTDEERGEGREKGNTKQKRSRFGKINVAN